MSLGSISPTSAHSCIKDIQFKNITFDMPLKAIYIKTNPGYGTGEITNILYENIQINNPLWWAVYIGPQ